MSSELLGIILWCGTLPMTFAVGAAVDAGKLPQWAGGIALLGMGVALVGSFMLASLLLGKTHP